MLLKQGYGAPMMKSSNGHHRELVIRCEILISQMAVTFYVYLFLSSMTDKILTGLNYN
jgi:hypothetical protein